MLQSSVKAETVTEPAAVRYQTVVRKLSGGSKAASILGGARG
jgi:hypothetical protein